MIFRKIPQENYIKFLQNISSKSNFYFKFLNKVPKENEMFIKDYLNQSIFLDL